VEVDMNRGSSDQEASVPLPDVGDEEILLRALRADDAFAIARWCSSDREILRWVMRPDPFTEKDAAAWIEERHVRHQKSEQLTLAIADRASGQLAGAIWLGRFDWIARRGELAYWVGAGFRGRHFGARAVSLVTVWALDELDLVRAQILVPVQNPASQSVALRAGFVREGVLRSYRSIRGEPIDHVAFSRLKTDAAPSASSFQPQCRKVRSGRAVMLMTIGRWGAAPGAAAVRAAIRAGRSFDERQASTRDRERLRVRQLRQEQPAPGPTAVVRDKELPTTVISLYEAEALRVKRHQRSWSHVTHLHRQVENPVPVPTAVHCLIKTRSALPQVRQTRLRCCETDSPGERRRHAPDGSPCPAHVGAAPRRAVRLHLDQDPVSKEARIDRPLLNPPPHRPPGVPAVGRGVAPGDSGELV
jgi:RimJ/RimL family protein N-acetyltransferase